MNICIIGTGYVGLVTGVGLAAVGHQIKCMDIDAERVGMIQRGDVPFYERDLPELLHQVQAEGRFSVTTDAETAILESEITFIAVGTPTENGQQDLSAVNAATHSIGEVLQESDTYHVVVVKSTVLPGTTRGTVRDILLTYLSEERFGLCMNPEFLREGNSVDDFMQPDRIIIGQFDERAGDVLERVYESFDCPILRTSLENAELTKYASNSLLSTLISFSNEIAAICENTPNTNVVDVMEMLHLDKRWSPMVDDVGRVSPPIMAYLMAGCGYGGSCLPKDIQALVTYGQSLGIELPQLSGTIQVNEKRPSILVEIAESVLGDLWGKTITILGLAFKPDTDDTRASSSWTVINELGEKGVKIRAFDPLVGSIEDEIPVQLFETIESALMDSDGAIICTAWGEFRSADWEHLTSIMRSPLVVDGRNLLRGIGLPDNMIYRGIGRRPI